MSASLAQPAKPPAQTSVADKPAKPAAAKPPRMWPAIGLVAIYWVAWAIVTLFYPGTFVQFLTIFWTPIGVAVGMLVWWLFFSRLPWTSRLFGVGCVGLFGVAEYLLSHTSVAIFGTILYALPTALTAAVAWLVISRGATTLQGRLGLIAVCAVTWGYFDLLRVDGVTGALAAERSWRWTETAEQRYLRLRQAANQTSEGKQPAAPGTPQRVFPTAPNGTPQRAEGTPLRAVPTALVASGSDWPAFRGPLREGEVRGVRIAADWNAQPSREVWRRPIGPGWSSFVVIGKHVFTQEQRGEAEAVLCFDLASGEELWSHEDKSRFEDVVSGAGPRATPTFDGGKLYSLGGRGVLNCLEAASGKLHWSRDISKDAKTEPPMWGFSSSPLVAHGLVSVFAGGKDGKSILAYDAQTGDLKWSGGQGIHSYSSPQLATIGDSEQLLMVSDHGLQAFEPASGKLLWEHSWILEGMFRVCQPRVLAGKQVLLATSMTGGTRLLSVAKNGESWSASEDWTTLELKPYFNDFVIHGGHLYGFDNNIFTCLDLASGKRKWKKGRYGHGQVLLVGGEANEQAAARMIVLSDTGEAVLIEGTPQGLIERGRLKVLEGKTWNHPVLTADGKLLVRNGQEMACYELPQ